MFCGNIHCRNIFDRVHYKQVKVKQISITRKIRAVGIRTVDYYMITIYTKNGKKIQVVSSDEKDKFLSDSDKEMDYRATQAVKAALHRAKICKKPIAGYDADTKRAYIEYPNGERKYVE